MSFFKKDNCQHTTTSFAPVTPTQAIPVATPVATPVPAGTTNSFRVDTLNITFQPGSVLVGTDAAAVMLPQMAVAMQGLMMGSGNGAVLAAGGAATALPAGSVSSHDMSGLDIMASSQPVDGTATPASRPARPARQSAAPAATTAPAATSAAPAATVAMPAATAAPAATSGGTASNPATTAAAPASAGTAAPATAVTSVLGVVYVYAPGLNLYHSGQGFFLSKEEISAMDEAKFLALTSGICAPAKRTPSGYEMLAPGTEYDEVASLITTKFGTSVTLQQPVVNP